MIYSSDFAPRFGPPRIWKELDELFDGGEQHEKT
jgi:hypothetical protein